MIASFELLGKENYFSTLDIHFSKTLCEIAKEDNPFVILAAAVASRFTSAGHVCAPINKLAGARVLGPDGAVDLEWPSLEDWIPALEDSSLVGNGESPTPLVLSNGLLYLHRYWQYESFLAADLAERAGVEMIDIDEELLNSSLEGQTNSEHRLAIETAMRSGLTVISGGPGTGKTSTVVAILATLFEQAQSQNRQLPRVVLLAPTGKAAARLTESIASAKEIDSFNSSRFSKQILDLVPDEAGTIHRVLGTRRDKPTSFIRDRENPLSADVVVVDEVSMVDIALMAKLFLAVPREARLVLLGDKNQLSSVEAGAVLGDIDIPGKVINLTQSYRFGSASGIGRLAEAVNKGESEKVISGLMQGEFDGATLIETTDWDSRAMENFLESHLKSRYVAYLKQEDPLTRLRLFESFRILAAHRQGFSGVTGINHRVQRILQKDGLVKETGQWYDGRPVMITRNDYGLGLFNGDVAVTCKKPGDESTLCAVFPDGVGSIKTVSLSRLQTLETAFAMTVHKSQGSEFDQVVVVLPPRPSPVVTRQLLYTAITRARQQVTILAPEKVLKEAIETPVDQAIGLGQRLKALIG